MLGIDIVKNERIKTAVERFGDRFLSRVYTQKELEYCKAQKCFFECLSARWACKEAVLKAFYQRFGIVLKLSQIEVLGDRGKPAKVNILGDDLKGMLESVSIWVSISHERDYSVAVALIEAHSYGLLSL
ncbi:holo-ACP synthase [Hydrogenobacter thermophilus]|uniref:Holo-[acyl-carrier-protein] synthase n=1 Tax=Hydrogenobacter thermophilus (strain DSM 6534 / IAM 12695 / TK-6) TaxID=608538 RepID=D3DFC0_HYDTT|nr:holo-ACP synthase [Hydrogenobacter thermophilus]BAI68522.1 holo-acyl-carrier-protein synthase [Hydrogenobacter thermophilus TK-6]